MFDFLADLFHPRVSAHEFEQRVFALVARRIHDRKMAESELKEVAQLETAPRDRRERLAAHLYLAFEGYLANDQPRTRIAPETLRGQVYAHCAPQYAEGGFPLLFLPSSMREIRLYERFTDTLFARAKGVIEPAAYSAIFEDLRADANLVRFVRGEGFAWRSLERKIRHLTAEEQAQVVQTLLKRAVEILVRHVMGEVDAIRTELLVQQAYREYRDTMDFIEDIPALLHIVPEALLAEERIELLPKAELEHELRKKSEELELTLSNLEAEKEKLSTLTREELETRVEKRTKELMKALEDVKAGRAEVEAAKAKDEAFLEGVAEGLVAIDRDWNIQLWNRAAGSLTRWTKDEAMGKSFKHFVKFVSEDDHGEQYGFIEEALHTRKVVRGEGRSLLVTRTGKELPVSLAAAPIFDARNEISSVIVIFHDISKERELEETRQEFASLATHELRAPVTIIKGYASLLLDGTAGALSDEQKKYIGSMKEANERLLELINAMLNASRLELGTIAIEPEPVYLPDLVDKVAMELGPQCEAKHITIAKDYDRKLPIVNADPRLTRAIVQNLLSNAVKYTPEQGTVKVVLAQQPPDILIRVVDSGYGIPEKQQDKIFSKFFRADNVREKQIEGTGLGLYIVRSVVEQAGGKMVFVSPVPTEERVGEGGPGTAFSVTIPLSGMKRKEGLKGLS